MSHAADIVDVAVGVLYDRAGRVLVNRRPPGKAFAGLWEFPGGKIEDGETASTALARELEEELGIAIEGHRPLITLSHDYDGCRVRLHVLEILDHRGRPSSREGQELEWVAPDRLGERDLLPANAAIVRAVRLPRLCLITDVQRFGVDHTLERLARHVASRRVLLIVRERSLGAGDLTAFVRAAREVCRPAGSPVVVHANCDTAEVDEIGGVHLSAAGLARGDERDDAGLLGASCHSEAELEAAGRHDCDYALLSPVQATTSHPSAPPLGWDGFAALAGPAALPVYALGGMTLTDLGTAFEHGAQGVAMLGAAWA